MNQFQNHPIFQNLRSYFDSVRTRLDSFRVCWNPSGGDLASLNFKIKIIVPDSFKIRQYVESYQFSLSFIQTFLRLITQSTFNQTLWRRIFTLGNHSASNFRSDLVKIHSDSLIRYLQSPEGSIKLIQTLSRFFSDLLELRLDSFSPLPFPVSWGLMKLLKPRQMPSISFKNHLGFFNTFADFLNVVVYSSVRNRF